jgi:hypothetical protein
MKKSILAVLFVALAFYADASTRRGSLRGSDHVLTFDSATEISETAVKGIIFEDSGGNIRTNGYDEVNIQWSDLSNSIIDPETLQTQITENAEAIDGLGGFSLSADAIAKVITPNGWITYHTTMQSAADALVDGCTLDVLREANSTTNLHLSANNWTWNGNGIPWSITRSSYTPSHGGADQKACVVVTGNDIVINDLVWLGEDAAGFPTNNHFYSFVLDAAGVSNIYFNNCRIQGNITQDYINPGAPKVFVSTHHTNIVYRGGAIGYYTDIEDRTVSRKIIDMHEDYSSARFIGTKFYASDPDLWLGGDPPFNMAGNAMSYDSFNDCYYNGKAMQSSAASESGPNGVPYELSPSGGLFPSKSLTLAEVRAVAFPSTELLFTQDDITADNITREMSEPYSGSVFQNLTEPRLVSGGDYTTNQYLLDCFEVERYDYRPTGADSDLWTYSKVFVADAQTAQSIKAGLIVPYATSLSGDTGGANYYTNYVLDTTSEFSVRCFAPQWGASATTTADTEWSAYVNAGVVVDVDHGDPLYPTDSELRLVINSLSNLTVSAGDIIEIPDSPANTYIVCDRDQTSATNIYVRAWSDRDWDYPSAGDNLIHNGTTYTGAFNGVNLTSSTTDPTESIATGGRGFYVTDVGIGYWGRTVGPCIMEVFVRQEEP